MKTRFLHFADCHLGYKQYNNKERYNDFARAFLDVINHALAEEVDFVILAGDLFQKRAIDALTLRQAVQGLRRLQEAGIPCIAVEGNHERAYYQDFMGWMDFLALEGLLTLISPPFQEGEPVLTPAGKKHRNVGYAEPVAGVRVYGLPYLGASTLTAINAYAQVLADQPADGVEYAIFVAHAGVQGVLADEAGGLSYRQWSALHPHVDYLALGHIHKPFEFEEWIFNPGSPETCSISEAAWPERGYYLVDVDTGRDPKHTARLKANSRRVFHRLRLAVDHFGSPEELETYVQEFLRRKARDLHVDRLSAKERPVVELQLTGVLAFDRSALAVDRLETLIQETFDPLHAMVKNHTRATEYAVDVEEGMSRPQLERQVIMDLLDRDQRFQGQSAAWAKVAISLKQLALSGAAPQAILDEVADAVGRLATKDDRRTTND
jgi:DNA repair exonuclease SbcCD nuclease subunit